MKRDLTYLSNTRVWLMNDMVINKIATIERCLQRINLVYAEVGVNLTSDFRRQYSIVLNLHRTCKASID